MWTLFKLQVTSVYTRDYLQGLSSGIISRDYLQGFSSGIISMDFLQGLSPTILVYTFITPPSCESIQTMAQFNDSFTSSSQTTAQFNAIFTSSSQTSIDKRVDFIDASVVPTIAVLTLASGFVIQMLGAVTNYINMVVFCKVGLKDTVSLSFFFLSLSDFLYMLFNGLGNNGCQLINIANPRKPWAKDFGTFGNYFIWYSVVFKDYTLTVSAFIAVARCCLVAWPFHFKSAFTLYRTCVSLVGIFLVTVVIHMPMYFTQGLELVFDALTNGTRLVSWQNSERKNTLVFHDMMVRNIVPYSCIILLAVSLIILTTTLVSASRFRKGLTTRAHQPLSRNIKSPERDLSTRDVRVIKAVCFISGSYLVGFIPTALQSFFRLIFPEFNLGKTYSNTFILVLAIAVTTAHLNSAINIVFYWSFNTKYRERLHEYCCIKKNVEKD
ncbi:hypothetical protein Btru_021212 [Bulinus truncatus]|nr:hypothetical protein Btru_021212 [Bulinus truncatus]